MWKKLLSLLKGKKEVCKEDSVLKSSERKVVNGQKVDSSPMFSKLLEDEYAFLSFAQGKLRKGRSLLSQRKFSEVRDELKPLITIVKYSLIINYSSERREKLLDIVEGSTIIADSYMEECNYSNAYDVLEDAQNYVEELTLLASNLKGTLTLIAQMHCMHLKCCNKLGKENGIEIIRKKIESVLAILSSCISSSPIADKIQIIERICDYLDELIEIEAYKDACGILSQMLSILKWEEIDDYLLKHSYAILYGRYVGCLLNSSPNDMNECKRICDSEIEMYMNLLEEKDSVQAKLDLAVAYSHMAECYSLKEDNPNFVASHIRKIILLVDAIKTNTVVNEDKIYNNKRLSKSIVISIKNCINEFGEVNGSNVNYYKDIFNAIKDINKYYLDDSELLAYTNLVAGELFKYISDDGFMIAQECLITRFTSLLYLLNKFGPEKDVIKDFADTIAFAQPFIINNEQTISDELRDLWIKSYSRANEIFKV